MTDRAYARISLDTARSGSIAKQRARLARVADAPVWYVDESVSGAKVAFADRDGGGRLLEDLQRGDRVLVTKIDRAARNVTDLLGLVRLIEDRGASIVFVDQNLDTSGPMGRFMLTLLAAVAELEAAIIAERARESRAAFMDEGRFGGGPLPFGFLTGPNPSGRGLVLRPDPETAPTAREAVARVLAGEPQRQIAPDLGLGESGFSRWLRNPALAGIRPGPELAVDTDAALLSLVEWRRLQDHLKRPVKAWTRADGYGAALACGVCGDRLYYARNKARPASSVYRCARRRHADGDPAVAVTARTADEHLEREFLARYGRLPVYERVTVELADERDEAVARARLRIDAARDALDAAETDEGEDAAYRAYRDAKRALKAAEDLPTATVTEEVATGETFAETWEGADDGTRTALLLKVGPWTVAPGRGLPIAAKVRREDAGGDYGPDV